MSNKKQLDISECKDFIKVIQDFIPDLLNTFPEYKDKLDKNVSFVLTIDLNTMESREFTEEELDMVRELLSYCNKVYPERFFDIIYQNEDIFKKEEYNSEFIPGIDFKELWKQNITDSTRSVLWKYLQLITFAVVFVMKDKMDFGETAKMFEAIDEETLKTKLADTLKDMKDIFEKTEDVSMNTTMPDVSSNIPNAEDIHEHINGILNGKIGLLAKEIGDEAMKDLNIDLEKESSIDGIMKSMFKNPGKLMKIFNTVSNKLQDKIKSGELDEKELMEEATQMMGKMNSMPMMNNIQDIMKKMGNFKGMDTSKIDMNAMMSQMNMRMNKNTQIERMRNKLNNRVVEPFKPNMEGERVMYSKGDKPERSKRIVSSHNEGVKKGNGNKNKNKKRNKNKKNKK